MMTEAYQEIFRNAAEQFEVVPPTILCRHMFGPIKSSHTSCHRDLPSQTDYGVVWNSGVREKEDLDGVD
eukprot:530529-Hanusia_phi.AAC.2